MKNKFMAKKWTIKMLRTKLEGAIWNSSHGPVDAQIAARIRAKQIKEAIASKNLAFSGGRS